MTEFRHQYAPEREGFTLGIDLGAAGAVSLLDGAGRLMDVRDLPCLDDGPRARPTVSASGFAAIVREWCPDRRRPEEHVTMTDQQQAAPHPLRSTLGLLEREAARRAKGTHPGMMRLDDAELAALVEVLRREVGTVETQGATGR